MKAKFDSNRLRLWLEISRRRSRRENVMVEEKELVEHFEDLFATQINSEENKAFDDEVEGAVKREIDRIMMSESRISVD